MSIDTVCYRQDRPADAAEPAMVHMIVFATLSIFAEFGSSRFSRLLDVIAETEYFHEMTMID